jgi:hypothetical protein
MKTGVQLADFSVKGSRPKGAWLLNRIAKAYVQQRPGVGIGHSSLTIGVNSLTRPDDHIRLRIVAKHVSHMSERPRQQFIIRAEPTMYIAPGVPEAFIQAIGLTVVLLAKQRVKYVTILLQRPCGRVSAFGVSNNNLEISVLLIYQRKDRTFQKRS